MVSRGVVRESPAVTGEVPEQQLTETSCAREPNYEPGNASSRPVEAFKRRCPGEAQRFTKFRNGDLLPQEPEITSSLAASTIRSRAGDIGSDISGHGTSRTTSNEVRPG